VRLAVLAQDENDTTTDETTTEDDTLLDLIGDPAGDAVDGLADLLAPYVPEQLEFVVDNLVSPGLRILLIVFFAGVLVRVARRGIDRAVVRMKDPDAGRSGRLRRSRERKGTDLEEDLRRTQRADALGSVARSFAGAVIWTIAIIMVLGALGVEVAPLIAGAGIVGVGIGFGAQDLVKDFLSGVFMLIEDQYGVGDIIDVGEAAGVVEGISLRSTRIRSIDGTLWHVPNGEIRRVGNMSQDFAMALLDIGVSYGTDVDVASDLIQRVAASMAEEEQYAEIFLDVPEIMGVETLGADGVDIRLRIKTKPGMQWGVSRELRRRLKKAFDATGIEIPFPQRTVWLRTEQPVALGDAEVDPFAEPMPDDAAMRRAVEDASRGDTGAPDELADLLPDAPLDGEPGADADER
jgi:small-conductance mechanosensitive channel